MCVCVCVCLCVCPLHCALTLLCCLPVRCRLCEFAAVVPDTQTQWVASQTPTLLLSLPRELKKLLFTSAVKSSKPFSYIIPRCSVHFSFLQTACKTFFFFSFFFWGNTYMQSCRLSRTSSGGTTKKQHSISSNCQTFEVLRPYCVCGVLVKLGENKIENMMLKDHKDFCLSALNQRHCLPFACLNALWMLF